MELLLLVFLCDDLVEFGEARLLGGVMSSITISLEWLELWWRVFGFVGPVMVLGRSSKQTDFEYTIMAYARDLSMVCEFRNRITRSILSKCFVCGARSLEIKAGALLGVYVPQA